MKVPFYGHQRQYLSIRNEIDENIREVKMSGQYVQVPMQKSSKRSWLDLPVRNSQLV